MKIALCLHGLTGGSKGKDGQGIPLDLKTPFDSFQNHLLSKNNIDIFIHSWSTDQEKDLNQLYNPKLSSFESQINFDSEHRKHIIKSRWYSAKESIKLKSTYETQYNIKYDIVMLCRLDLIWFNDVIFSNYTPHNFYASHWNLNGPDKVGPYDKSNHHINSGFLDFWFFSNSEYMNQFSLLYDNIDTLLKNTPLSSHSLSYSFIRQLNYPIVYTKYRGYDCEMYRRYKNPKWKLQ